VWSSLGRFCADKNRVAKKFTVVEKGWKKSGKKTKTGKNATKPYPA
jgi:hypothetical protein